MFKSALFVYGPAFSRTIVYMLQSVEYRPRSYLGWLWSVKDFQKVAYRKRLVSTRPARLLLRAFRIGSIAEYAVSILLLIHGLADQNYLAIGGAFLLLFFAPLVWAHLVILPLVLGDILIIKPLYRRKIKKSEKIFAEHPGIKIAIAGSYGKTTMKEILRAVLSEGKKVAATPANKNVSISHANFAQRLSGDEEVLIIEYGEGAPGDVGRFAKRTCPNTGIITGLAPAHLDRYKTLHAAGQDIFSLANYLDDKEVYVNGDSKEVSSFVKKSHNIFSAEGISKWKVKGVKVGMRGTDFTLQTPNGALKIKSRLVGRHLIAPLALAAFLGDKYGLSGKQIEDGIAKIEPFEHRMKPYQLSGAWIIDDTYNGNIDGMKAGLELLKELPAERKIYITPGLVDQGPEEEKVHVELGRMIKKANPHRVVLIEHSVTPYILKGLEGYEGELVIEDDPLDFYTNLDKFVAAGDLVLMQNDWPDQYS